MCQKCDAYKGKIEIVQFKCGGCGKCLSTFWATPHGGFLHGDYELIGQAFFHEKCADDYVKPRAEHHA